MSKKKQFSIRSIMLATLLFAAILPFAISNWDRIIEYLGLTKVAETNVHALNESSHSVTSKLQVPDGMEVVIVPLQL